MQRQAIQTITKSHYNANASPLFKELKILPFQELLLTFSKCMFMHLVEYKYCWPFVENSWMKNNRKMKWEWIHQPLNIEISIENFQYTLFHMPGKIPEHNKFKTLPTSTPKNPKTLTHSFLPVQSQIRFCLKAWHGSYRILGPSITKTSALLHLITLFVHFQPSSASPWAAFLN